MSVALAVLVLLLLLACSAGIDDDEVVAVMGCDSGGACLAAASDERDCRGGGDLEAARADLEVWWWCELTLAKEADVAFWGAAIPGPSGLVSSSSAMPAACPRRILQSCNSTRTSGFGPAHDRSRVLQLHVMACTASSNSGKDRWLRAWRVWDMSFLGGGGGEEFGPGRGKYGGKCGLLRTYEPP